jgi:hypothetical protein
MAVPRSFAAFQKLFEALPEPEATTPPAEPDLDPNTERRQRSLGYATDAILADLHDQENLRDAVINSIPNLENNSVILIINPTVDAAEELIDFLSNHPRVKRFALGARKRADGERVRAVKLDVVETDDESDPPDAEDREKKEEEQNNLKSSSEEEDQPLSNSFFRGSASSD